MYDFEACRARWNSRASAWDESVATPSCYVNKDDGYSRYLNFLYTSARGVIGSSVKKILDVGTGTGVVAASSKALWPSAKVFGMDCAYEMLCIARHKVPDVYFFAANALEMSMFLPKGEIDVVLTRGILLSHFGSETGDIFLSQVKWVLSCGGWFVFDCLSSEWNQRHREDLDKTYYTLQELDTWFHNQNFKRYSLEGYGRRTWNCLYRKE